MIGGLGLELGKTYLLSNESVTSLVIRTYTEWASEGCSEIDGCVYEFSEIVWQRNESDMSKKDFFGRELGQGPRYVTRISGSPAPKTNISSTAERIDLVKDLTNGFSELADNFSVLAGGVKKNFDKEIKGFSKFSKNAKCDIL